LIAALLNLYNGSNPVSICDTISKANALLSSFTGKLPYKAKPSSKTGQLMVSAGKTLDSYNNGQLTPRCTP